MLLCGRRTAELPYTGSPGAAQWRIWFLTDSGMLSTLVCNDQKAVPRPNPAAEDVQLQGPSPVGVTDRLLPAAICIYAPPRICSASVKKSRPMATIQIFGVKSSSATRAAERFSRSAARPSRWWISS